MRSNLLVAVNIVISTVYNNDSERNTKLQI